jgi:hypothetical protein
MTPSGAHDSAWQREPEHDEMTIACRDYIEREFKQFHIAERDKVHVHELVGVWCETFFPEGRGTFADILARWTCKYRNYESGPEQTRQLYIAYEIKPKLYSAGAAYRQAQVLLQRLKAWASDSHSYDDTHLTFVIAREDDPLVHTYLNLSRGSIYLWDGTQLRRESWKKPEEEASTPALEAAE